MVQTGSGRRVSHHKRGDVEIVTFDIANGCHKLVAPSEYLVNSSRVANKLLDSAAGADGCLCGAPHGPTGHGGPGTPHASTHINSHRKNVASMSV